MEGHKWVRQPVYRDCTFGSQMPSVIFSSSLLSLSLCLSPCSFPPRRIHLSLICWWVPKIDDLKVFKHQVVWRKNTRRAPLLLPSSPPNPERETCVGKKMWRWKLPSAPGAVVYVLMMAMLCSGAVQVLYRLYLRCVNLYLHSMHPEWFTMALFCSVARIVALESVHLVRWKENHSRLLPPQISLALFWSYRFLWCKTRHTTQKQCVKSARSSSQNCQP